MPVGIGLGRGDSRGRGTEVPSRFVTPRGVHPGALWLAAAAPVLATILLVARLAA